MHASRPAKRSAHAWFAFFAALLVAVPLESGDRSGVTAGTSTVPVLAAVAPAAIFRGGTDAPALGVLAPSGLSPSELAAAPAAVEPIVVASMAPLSDRPERGASGRVEPSGAAERASEGEGSLAGALAALLLVGWIVGRRRG